MPRMSPRLLASEFDEISPIPQVLELRSSSRTSSTLLFFLGGAVMLVILLVLLTILWKLLKPRGEAMRLLFQSKSLADSKDFLYGNLRTISYFDFQTLKSATKNFHHRNLLGTGGFGPVYRGKLGDGTLVAVKKLSLEKSQQGESEFLSEVRMITSIQHKNLVRLLGCCCCGPQRLLVYEYLKNRSLDLIIYGKSEQFLNWSTRFQIIIGVARGLQYLHEDSHLRIIHRDIKASNILLDDHFLPHIGDFGLARFFPEDQAYLSTTIAGTLGYTAPEYAIRGELSEKADIYSFGVLTLEIISCRRNTDLSLPSEMQYLPEYAWKLFEKSKAIELIDPKMKEDGFSKKEVLQAMHVAFLCLQPQPELRPRMSQVVSMLTCMAGAVDMPMKPPFLDRRIQKDVSISWDSITDPFPSALHSDSPLSINTSSRVFKPPRSNRARS
ncbi:hypothetical protein MLD38_014174 [Melastoma candidum]|uniref:Uncharacterized protein n=1 Tax=Melastoma candidum TaxID=119954 RepID=A0ACB9RBJ7_9MYRT|nr:hypothetical protein MLD38_014174 [Melastoma candidum]